MCPALGGLITGKGPIFKRGLMVAHCLLIETPAHGLVLVDTGFGLKDATDPKGRLGAYDVWALGAPREQDCALRQVERLGFRGEDVRHIVLTHMDLDHAGGIGDFPHAKIHVMRAEHRSAMARDGSIARMRYRPMHWEHGPDFSLHDPSRGESWRGFACVRELEGLPPEILMLPLSGHTEGHACVVVDRAEGPLVHAGDAYFHRAAVRGDRGAVPGGIRSYEWLLACDKQKVTQNHARLRSLASQSDITLFCAHDVEEYLVQGGTLD